jgi:alpha-galactosidase
MSKITRRDILKLALATPVATLASTQTDRLKQSLHHAPFKIIPASESDDIKNLKLLRQRQGPICRSRLVNRGRTAVKIKEVVLFDLLHSLPPETGLYGEAFKCSVRPGGTLGRPIDLSSLTDVIHYKLTVPAGARAVYGLMTLSPAPAINHVLAFISCRRFSGQFYDRDSSIQVVVDTEGLELKPGEAWELEEFTFRAGAHREQLLAAVADRLIENHPPLRRSDPSSGWCSWYCFGPRVTSQQVLDNLDYIAKHAPGLKYIQIDDGYQPAMGCKLLGSDARRPL